MLLHRGAVAICIPIDMEKGKRENSSVGRARPCQGRGRGFESRFSLNFESFGLRDVL